MDEAIALSFGKSPKVVNWKSISHLTTVSPFVAQYANIRDLAYRAMPWNEMFDPVLPGLFIAWARRLDIAFPKQLEEKVVARGGNVADWKSNFDALKKTCDDLVASKDDQYKKSMKITWLRRMAQRLGYPASLIVGADASEEDPFGWRRAMASAFGTKETGTPS